MGPSRRITAASLLIIALLATAGPVAGAKSSGPVSVLGKPGDCPTLTYEWSGYRKAVAATFELRHNGVYQDQATIAPVGAAGSATIPAQLGQQFVAGEHYTVMAFLRDASGRAIQNSPAVWYGYC